MLEIILLILGVFYMVRRPKIAAMRATTGQRYLSSGIDRSRSLELRSIDVFLAATWGTTAVAYVAGLVLRQVLAQQLSSPDRAIPD